MSRLLLDTLRETKHAIRRMAKAPGFSITVLLTLALGIGINTAMFSVIQAVLLKPLSYQDPDRLVLLTVGATPIRFEEMRDANKSYTEVVATDRGQERLSLTGIGLPEVLQGSRVSGNFLSVLGVRPILGRSFSPAEDTPSGSPVAMISAELWQRKFNGSPSIVGNPITLAGSTYTIIGVLPPKFRFPFPDTDVWLPRPSEWAIVPPASRRSSPILTVFGRLKPGVDLEEANAELVVLNHQHASAHPSMLDAKLDAGDRVKTLKTELISDVQSKLWMLFGAVWFVLLIVCANIASLMLARATFRTREFVVRAAVGASRIQLIRQLLAESLLFSALGGALGIGLAALALKVLRSVALLDLPRTNEIHIDGTVLLFAIAVSLLSGIAFGLPPALTASRPNLANVLRGSGEGAISASSKPMFFRLNSHSILVIAQMALSTVLLIGAALMIESLAKLSRVNPGFEVENLLTMSLPLAPSRYDTPEKQTAFYDQLLDRVDSLPGVRSAAVALSLPLTGFQGSPVQVAGRAPTLISDRPISITEDVTPGYFQTMQIALKRGRTFTQGDKQDAVPVVIINESFAHLFWPQYPKGPDPIGQHIMIGSHPLQIEVIGIVSDVLQTGMDSDPRPAVYRPIAQEPPSTGMLAVRTVNDPLSFTNVVRAQVTAIDPSQPIAEIESMRDVVQESQGQQRLTMVLLGVFAGTATLIAIVGLYGVIAYSVAQRTKEMGIRRALGAEQSHILRLVVGEGLRISICGVILGAGGALGLARVMRGFLFHISPSDPMTFTCVSALFVVVGVVASYIPARRASSVDPLIAIRG